MEQEQQTPGQRALELIRVLLPNWRQPTTQNVLRWIGLALAVGLAMLGVLLILDVIGLIFGITLLNLLKVLAIPITVGAAVPLLNWLQKKRELDVEKERAQDDALQAYLGKIAQLLTDKDCPLDKAKQGTPPRTVARAWTLTVLDTLDSSRLKGLEALDSGRRKRRVLKFLYEANLICADCAIVSLSKVNLSEAELNGIDLSGADLGGANLSKANLSKANLSGANLSRANLSRANLRGATHITNEQLEQQAASLEGATMPDGQQYEDWGLKSKGYG